MRFVNLIKSHWPLVLIVLAGGILRFWRLEEMTTFSGDQGYDFLIVKRMLVEKDFTLLGPKIGPYNEIGNLYLGPAYYYLLAPALLLFGLDPLGPAALTAALAILTIIIVYKITLKYLSYKTAILASFLYALNAFLITQSRASSNPHMIPFFSAAFIYALLETLYSKSSKLIWPFISGITLGIMFQLHYLSVSLAPLLSLLIFKKKYKQLLFSVISFLFAVSPQILFELRNEFFISNLFINQMRHGQNLSGLERFRDHIELSAQKITEIFYISWPFLFLSAGLFLIFLWSAKFRIQKSGPVLSILIASVIFSALLVSLYSGSIEFHYFATVYPAATILLAAAMIYVYKLLPNIFARGVISLLFLQMISASLLSLNLQASEGYTMPTGWNLKGTKKASQIIASDVSVSKFNIAATLDGDTRARPFRYLVEVYGKIPQDVEHFPDSEVIYLISRDEEEKIKGYTVWEIASFRPFSIEEKWEIQNGISLYKLVKSTNRKM
jgi:4-amino-4-deoxy-L-arabinose transferase-like glycosyltransferase